MKNLIVISISLIAFCLSAFSQSSPNPDCPTFSIEGPAGIPNEKEPIKFELILSKGAEKYDLQYFWSVTNEGIIKGQESRNIEVNWKELCNLTQTVTLEIKGLPEGCENKTSESLGISCCFTQPELLDEYSLSELQIDKVRLDNLISKLQENPNAQAYIIEKFPAEISKKIIDKKIKLITDYISLTRKQDVSRFTILTSENDVNLTQFFLVPPGAEPPTP